MPEPHYIDAALDAEERFTLDELESYAHVPCSACGNLCSRLDCYQGEGWMRCPECGELFEEGWR